VLQQPLALGADLVMHSGTKYLDGQGRVMAGALCGSRQLVDSVFAPMMRTAGMVLAPFNAWVVLKGLETLAVRVRRRASNALADGALAGAHPQVERVYYPACPRTRSMRWRWRSSRAGRRGGAFERAADSPEQARAQAPSTSSTTTRVLSASPPTWATPRPSSATRPPPRTAA
jgi:O-succinylhomoserine sulfhydrylase